MCRVDRHALPIVVTVHSRCAHPESWDLLSLLALSVLADLRRCLELPHWWRIDNPITYSECVYTRRRILKCTRQSSIASFERHGTHLAPILVTSLNTTIQNMHLIVFQDHRMHTRNPEARSACVRAARAVSAHLRLKSYAHLFVYISYVLPSL